MQCSTTCPKASSYFRGRAFRTILPTRPGRWASASGTFANGAGERPPKSNAPPSGQRRVRQAHIFALRHEDRKELSTLVPDHAGRVCLCAVEDRAADNDVAIMRSAEHTSELQSLMRI